MTSENSQNFSVPTVGDLFEAGAHIGHKKSRYHPSMKEYIFSLKNNIYIIDLAKTEAALKKAVEFIKHEVEKGALILFVGIKRSTIRPTKEVIEQLSMPYVVQRWLGGTLTNFKTIFSRIKYLEELEEKFKSGEFDKYSKKEKRDKEKELEDLKKKFNTFRKLSRLPDIIFVTDVRDAATPIREAKRTGVKTVGIVDTDGDPNLLDYPIPANDEASSSVKLILETIAKNIEGAKPKIGD